METLQPATTPKSRGLFRLFSSTCDLCGEPIHGSGYYYSEAGDGQNLPSIWTLCETCSTLVTRQLENIRAEAPQRLRIAVGVAASERGVTSNAFAEAREREEKGFNRLLIAMVWLAFIVHAVAFILVVVVIAASH